MEKNNSVNKKIIGFIVLMGLIVWFGYYVKTHISEFKSLSIVSITSLVLLVVLFLFLLLTNGLIAKYLLRAFKVNLNFKEHFGLSVISNFYSMLTPFRGGSIARAVYLKKRYKFPYMNFIAALSATHIINFMIASFVGMISLVMIYFAFNMFNLAIFLILLAIFLGLIVSIIIFPIFNKKLKKRFVFARLERLFKGWHAIRKKPDILFYVSVLMIIQFIIGGLDTMVTYNVFGINIGFLKALFLFSVSFLATIIALTPGSLGISELIHVFSALVVGITPAQALAAALLGRVVLYTVLFITGPIFSYILLKKAYIAGTT